MTDFNQNVIKTAGTFRLDKKDSPMDVRCRISTLSEIYRIPLPYLGMLVYNLADRKTYQVTALGPDPNAPVPEPDAVVAAFEVLEGGNGTQVAGKPFVDLGTTPASMTIHHDGNATPYAIYTLSDGGSGSTEGIILYLTNVVNNAYGEILLKQTGRYSVYLGNWIMSDGTTTPLQGQLRMEMSPGSDIGASPYTRKRHTRTTLPLTC